MVGTRSFGGSARSGGTTCRTRVGLRYFLHCLILAGTCSCIFGTIYNKLGMGLVPRYCYGHILCPSAMHVRRPMLIFSSFVLTSINTGRSEVNGAVGLNREVADTCHADLVRMVSCHATGRSDLCLSMTRGYKRISATFIS